MSKGKGLYHEHTAIPREIVDIPGLKNTPYL